MSAVMIILLCLFAMHAQIAGENQIWEDYCSVKRTNALKGIFVVIVFVSHFCGYLETGDQDALAVKMVSFLGQLMVTPFLFYSGFGVMEAIQKKGTGYVKKIPVHRALKTLLHFDVAVLLYCALNWLLGKSLRVTDILQALVCWKSVGNSTWYIFTMVFLYLITAVSFLAFRRNKYAALLAVTALSLVFIFVMMPFRDAWWYNTVFCYALGMWYSVLRPYVEKIICRNDLLYCSVLLAVFYVFRHLERFHWVSSWIFQVYAMTFVMLVVGISMKMRLDNPFLQFLGKHTFGIYILQRLPMIFFTEKGMFVHNNATLFILCFLITCILAMLFDQLTERLDRVVFNGKESVLGPRK